MKNAAACERVMICRHAAHRCDPLAPPQHMSTGAAHARCSVLVHSESLLLPVGADITCKERISADRSEVCT